METPIKRLSLYLTIAISIGTIIAAVLIVDNRWAKAERVASLECRLDRKITQDQADWTQRRIWTLQDRYQDKPMPQSVREEDRQLRKQLDQLLDELREDE